MSAKPTRKTPAKVPTLNKAQGRALQDLLERRYGDKSSALIKANKQGMPLNLSTLNRYLSGKTASRRTLAVVCKLLSVQPDSLLAQLNLACLPVRHKAMPSRGKRQRIQNPDAYRVTYQLWVEMSTRKIGQAIDPGSDVVLEIYDSWYAFFKEARILLRQIPLHEDPDSPELRLLIQTMQDVLNHCLRPHLQRWQAEFGRWLQLAQKTTDGASSPQQLQTRFPGWTELLAELLSCNRQLIEHTHVLAQMLGLADE
jgi:hypothetical protein